MANETTDQNKLTDEVVRNQGVRFGIGFKLFGAFAGVASLTLLASIVAYFSYSYISQGLYRFEIEGIPAISQSQTLARKADELSAISSMLVHSKDDAQLAAALYNLKLKRDELSKALEDLSGAPIDADTMASLKSSVREFDQNADRLGQSIAQRIEATQGRKALVVGALAANRSLREQLAPVIDDAGFALIGGLEQVSEGRGSEADARAQSKTAVRQAVDLQALVDLRAEANRMIGVITEVSLTPRADQLPPLGDEFAASAGRARAAVINLSNQEISQRLRAALEKLLAYGDGGDGIFEARKSELSDEDEGAALVAANGKRQETLAADVQRVVDAVILNTSLDVARSRAAIINSQSLLVVIVAVSVLLAVALAWIYVGHGLLRRLVGLSDAILALADGDLDVAIPHESADELSRMANAIEVFKQHAIQARDFEVDKERGRIADLKRREASFRLLFESNPVPMWVFDLETFQFLSVNDAAIAHYGYARDRFLAMSIFDIMPPEDRERLALQARTPGRSKFSEGHWRHVKADGSAIDVLVYPQELTYEGSAAALTAVIDVTESKQAEARIAHMAHHDALTDLANRTLFRERLNQALARMVRRKNKAAVLCIDLDRFKDVNDTMGHSAGDELLVAVADRLRACVRTTDTVSRFGGDEFAIVQDDIADVSEVTVLARRLLEQVNRPYRLEGREVTVSTSIGISVAPDDSMDADILLKSADVALYRAKAGGRSNFCFFEAETDARLRERRDLQVALRNALGKGELALHYQPLVDLQTNEVTGFEALLRWTNPQYGSIPPAEFIPLAEESGLIAALGEWVLQEACREAVTWPTDLTVAINLSPVQFVGGKLVPVVINALASSGLAARRLELEITESVLLQENEHNIATLRQLHDLGARISLDDFGTGYSSLGYLRSFPFDKIKIDRSFINEIGDSAECRTIVRAIVELASGLRMVTTAEGVESVDQLERLRAEGCTEAQGYVFSQPMQSFKIREFLAEHRRLYGSPTETWSSFRKLLVEAGLERAARDFAVHAPASRRAANQ
ncbi:MAG TPA: EAL domain-containing protein [Roseiarcus sp.]|nr:EAL domain-containing protein [Roseiarcus sp.]